MSTGGVASTSGPIREELLPGERVLWSGQPRKDILFSRGDLFLVPFTLVWFGVVIMTVVSGGIVADEGDPMSVVIGSLFLLIGLLIGTYATVGRFFYKRRRRSRTFYAVTDRRVIAVIRGRRENVLAQFIDSIPTVNRSIRKDGVGTIRFGSAAGHAQALNEDSGLELLWPYGGHVPTFYDINDAIRVYELVQGLRGGTARQS